MRRLVLAVSCCCVLACSGDDDDDRDDGALDADYTANFVGRWVGPQTLTANGGTSTVQVYLPIAADGFNRLALEGVCADDATYANVTSPSAFALVARTCPAMAVEGCDAVTLRYDHGTGTVASGSLSFTTAGTISGCGLSFTFTASMTGTRSTVVAQAAPRSWAAAATRLLEP